MNSDLYGQSHFHWWCRRRHYVRLKREKFVTVGDLGVIVGL